MNPLDFDREIERALARYASDKTEDEKRDLRQECCLALVNAGDRILGRGQAYRTCRNRILDIFKSAESRAAPLSLSDPAILAKTDLITTVSDHDTSIDLERAVDKLSQFESEVIRLAYGFYGSPLSQRQIAARLGKTEWWVRTKHKSALSKLRFIFAAKEPRNAS